MVEDTCVKAINSKTILTYGKDILVYKKNALKQEVCI